MADDLTDKQITDQAAALLTEALKRPRRYSLGDVIEFTEVDVNRLRRWLDAAIITTAGGGSQGKRREFSFRNLVEVAVCDELRGLGVSEISLRDVIAGLRRYFAAGVTAAPILWIAFERYALANDPTPRETLQIRTCDLATLGQLLIGGDPNGNFKVESGIAVPIERIIADLEKQTGDTFA